MNIPAVRIGELWPTTTFTLDIDSKDLFMKADVDADEIVSTAVSLATGRIHQINGDTIVYVQPVSVRRLPT